MGDALEPGVPGGWRRESESGAWLLGLSGEPDPEPCQPDPAAEAPKTLFLFQYGKDRIVTSGSHFFGQYWCDAVGARNVASSIRAQNQNAVITMEQVYAWDPDLIFITNFTPAEPQDLYRNAYHDWKPVKAVREKQVFKMPLGTYRTFTPSADTR